MAASVGLLAEEAVLVGLATLLFQANPVKIGSITLDACTAEEHSSEVELTDHPVEKGADISDHRRPKPKTLKLTGIVSNTPLEYLSLNNKRAENAWDALNELQAGEELITVVTTLQNYDDMVITRISVPRDAARGNVIEVTIELRELIQVASETVAAPQVTAVKKLGRVPTPPVPDPIRASLFSKVPFLTP